MIETSFNTALKDLVDGFVSDKTYLLGVSGGIDSMCMAELFLRSHFNLKFAIAHVNFSLRGEDSIGDMNMVKEWAERHSIPFFCITFDTHAYAHKHSISTQMAARDLRYGWFREILDKEGYDYLAIAHNLNDSVETMFLNIVRGTGIKGIGGISRKNGRIIRPLLDVTRQEIVDYVAENSIQYRDDVTNFESHYSRNRIRNIIFPEFRKLNPSFLQTVEKESRHFREINDIIEDLYLEKKKLYCTEDNGKYIVSSDILKNEKQGEYWLYRILKDFNYNGGQLSEIVKCIQEGQNGKSFYSPTCEMCFNKGDLNIYPLSDTDLTDESIQLTEPCIFEFKGRSLKLDIFVRPKDFTPVPSADELYFSFDKTALPIICRNWKFADKFRPFGMKTGSKKISDFFTDLKFDKYQKNLQPILTDKADNIICLPGLRIDDNYKITPETKIIGKISFIDL